MNEQWTRRPDIAAKLLVQQGTIILEMLRDGKITKEEAGEMYVALYDRERLGPEVKSVVENNGILPLSGQTNRLHIWSWRTRKNSA
jgi:hypothetical protein